MAKEPTKVMISSSVYGSLSLLRQVYAALRSYKEYEIICSPVGTVSVNPKVSNLKSCLAAVEECQVYIGFIRPIYGSGRDYGMTTDGKRTSSKSITHLELEKAIALDRPRWMLVHSSVVRMRSLVRHVFYDEAGVRNNLPFKELKGEFDDPRVIEMYELAADSNSEKPWSQRTNHWVHEYHYDFEALDFINAQFSDPKRLAAYLNPPTP